MNSVRIIGGLYRGKKITFPAMDDLRPTPDRIKETLFNWLMHDLRGARCLDAFAGSGSLGFEAFSRGASEVILIESSPLALTSLKRTALTFNRPGLSIIKADACDYLKTTHTPNDIIFLDPPFTKDYLGGCVQSLETDNCLIPGGLLYIESPNEIILDVNHWLLRKSKKAGQVFYALFEKRKSRPIE